MRRNLNKMVRTKFGLDVVITVVHASDKGSDELGQKLAKAAGGFLDEKIHATGRVGKETRIGVSWGYCLNKVADDRVDQSDSLNERLAGLIPQPEPPGPEGKLIWCPLVGILKPPHPDWEAGNIAEKLGTVYGGDVIAFLQSGIVLPDGFGPASRSRKKVEDFASKSDVILTSLSHWHEEHKLLTQANFEPKRFPLPSSGVAALMCGVFLASDGSEVPGEENHYRFTGLGYAGFLEAAGRRVVVLVAGGEERRPGILAAIRGKLISSLVTTKMTAEWLLEQDA